MPSYEADLAKFERLNAQVLGVSIDHVPCVQAWAKSLGGISYPLLSDFWPHGDVCQLYGVLRTEGYSERAIFVIDPEGIIRYIDIHDINDQPDNDVLLAEVRKLVPGAKEELEPESPVSLPHGGTVMYCTRWCMDCARARDWFLAHGLPLVEVDLNATPGAAHQVREWTGGHIVTPTFDIDGTIVIDFDPDRLSQVLGVDKE